MKPNTHKPLRAGTLHVPVNQAAIAAVYDSSRWQRLRRMHLAASPLCIRCLSLGTTTAAQQVHHVIPLKTDLSLAYIDSNLQSTCYACHSIIERELNK